MVWERTNSMEESDSELRWKLKILTSGAVDIAAPSLRPVPSDGSCAPGTPATSPGPRASVTYRTPSAA